MKEVRMKNGEVVDADSAALPTCPDCGKGTADLFDFCPWCGVEL